MIVSAFDLAERFVGMREIPGHPDNPQILAMLRLDAEWPKNDEVPWCSAFVNYIAWLLRLPRSKSLRARSWLDVGRPVEPYDARVGFDVVVLERWSQTGDPGAGHVGFYAGTARTQVFVLGGNQSDSVTIAPYPMERIVGVRRLFDDAGPGSPRTIRT